MKAYSVETFFVFVFCLLLFWRAGGGGGLFVFLFVCSVTLYSSRKEQLHQTGPYQQKLKITTVIIGEMVMIKKIFKKQEEK